MSKQEKLNMLIVDDEIDILKSLKRLFRRDFNITLANSGEDALACIAEKDTPGCFDIILTDQRMKGIQGSDLLKEVYATCGETASILVTGYSDMPSLIKAINEGRVYGYMPKPWEPNDLKQMVFDSIKRLKSIKINDDLLKQWLADRNYWLMKISLDCHRALFELKENHRNVQLKSINLSEYIEQFYSDLSVYAIQKDIDFTIESDNNCIVPVDAYLINHIICALYANAIKYTKPKGKIFIRTLDCETYVRVEVQDSGIGIESDLHQHITNKIKPACRPGTDNESSSGHGLLMVNEFLKYHNSCLDLKNNDESGSLVGFNIQK
jgi:FixJ family two-component response regulator